MSQLPARKPPLAPNGLSGQAHGTVSGAGLAQRPRREATPRTSYGEGVEDLEAGGASLGSGGIFKNAAFEILKQEERLMTSGEITKLAIERRLLKCMGKTPENTMASALYTEVRKKAGTTVFIKPKEGLFGLKAWLNEPWLLNWLAQEGIEIQDFLDPALPADAPFSKRQRTSYNGSARAPSSAAGFYGAAGSSAPANGVSGGNPRTSFNGRTAIPGLDRPPAGASGAAADDLSNLDLLLHAANEIDNHTGAVGSGGGKTGSTGSHDGERGHSGRPATSSSPSRSQGAAAAAGRSGRRRSDFGGHGRAGGAQGQGARSSSDGRMTLAGEGASSEALVGRRATAAAAAAAAAALEQQQHVLEEGPEECEQQAVDGCELDALGGGAHPFAAYRRYSYSQANAAGLPPTAGGLGAAFAAATANQPLLSLFQGQGDAAGQAAADLLAAHLAAGDAAGSLGGLAALGELGAAGHFSAATDSLADLGLGLGGHFGPLGLPLTHAAQAQATSQLAAALGVSPQVAMQLISQQQQGAGGGAPVPRISNSGGVHRISSSGAASGSALPVMFEPPSDGSRPPSLSSRLPTPPPPALGMPAAGRESDGALGGIGVPGPHRISNNGAAGSLAAQLSRAAHLSPDSGLGMALHPMDREAIALLSRASAQGLHQQLQLPLGELQLPASLGLGHGKAGSPAAAGHGEPGSASKGEAPGRRGAAGVGLEQQHHAPADSGPPSGMGGRAGSDDGNASGSPFSPHTQARAAAAFQACEDDAGAAHNAACARASDAGTEPAGQEQQHGGAEEGAAGAAGAGDERTPPPAAGDEPQQQRQVSAPPTASTSASPTLSSHDAQAQLQAPAQGEGATLCQAQQQQRQQPGFGKPAGAVAKATEGAAAFMAAGTPGQAPLDPQLAAMLGILAQLQQQHLELLPTVDAAQPGDVADPEAINRIRQQVVDMEARLGPLHPECGKAHVLLARVLEHKGTLWSLGMAERALLRAWTIAGHSAAAGTLTAAAAGGGGGAPSSAAAAVADMPLAGRRQSETTFGAVGVAAAAAAEAGAAGAGEMMGQMPDSFGTFAYLLEQVRRKQTLLQMQQQQQVAALFAAATGSPSAGMSGVMGGPSMGPPDMTQPLLQLLAQSSVQHL